MYQPHPRKSRDILKGTGLFRDFVNPRGSEAKWNAAVNAKAVVPGHQVPIRTGTTVHIIEMN
jgi:hypothetical protein